MGIDHGGLEVGVAQQFLDGPDVIPLFHQVGGKAVPEGMDGCPFTDLGLGNRELELFLDT
jgi:hypothetical protein